MANNQETPVHVNTFNVTDVHLLQRYVTGSFVRASPRAVGSERIHSLPFVIVSKSGAKEVQMILRVYARN